MEICITGKKGIEAKISVPGDKSISHRAVMLGSIAKGDTKISGFLHGLDCMSTISCFEKMGIEIEVKDTDVTVRGNGLRGLSAPAGILDAGNSGTTLRLLTGLLAGQEFDSIITGDDSIKKRPMNRVAAPLEKMGGQITSLGPGGDMHAPLKIKGSPLKGAEHILPIASAQVKSAIYLAALYARGETSIIEPYPTRDHTEIMLRYMGAYTGACGRKLICHGASELFARDIRIPGDISSAAFFIVASLIRPGSHLIIKDVGLNFTRMGIIYALLSMGAKINILRERNLWGEPFGDIEIFSSPLKGTTIEGEIIPRLIDEIPAIAVAAAYADGVTVIKNAEELKVKESDRIKTLTEELSKMGVSIKETPDGMIIRGGNPLFGAVLESRKDHRIAMALSVAALGAKGKTTIKDSECADISFPGFYELLERI